MVSIKIKRDLSVFYYLVTRFVRLFFKACLDKISMCILCTESLQYHCLFEVCKVLILFYKPLLSVAYSKPVSPYQSTLLVRTSAVNYTAEAQSLLAPPPRRVSARRPAHRPMIDTIKNLSFSAFVVIPHSTQACPRATSNLEFERLTLIRVQRLETL